MSETPPNSPISNKKIKSIENNKKNDVSLPIFSPNTHRNDSSHLKKSALHFSISDDEISFVNPYLENLRVKDLIENYGDLVMNLN